MRCWLKSCAVLWLLSVSAAAVAEEAPDEKTIQALVAQLGDGNFKQREEAEKKLIEIGAPALKALRSAAKSPNAEMAFRSQRAIRQITQLSPDEQQNLRMQGQAAFFAGDYDNMARIYRRLIQAETASVDDGRWLGHAYHLSSRWKEAAEAYLAAIDHMDRLLEQHPAQGELNAPMAPNSPWPTANRNGQQERAAALLLVARIQRFYLNDPAAAELTLRRTARYNAILNEPLDDVARKWRGRIAEALQTGKDVQAVGQDHQRSIFLRFPLMALRELAEVQQLNGHHADALETWRRIHWTTRQYGGHDRSIDAAALDRLLRDLPAEKAATAPAVTFLDEQNPSAEFDLSDAATLSKSYGSQYHYWEFALAAPKGMEFRTLDFTCDVEQMELRYGGQFECSVMTGEPAVRKHLGSVYWPNGKGIGRDKLTETYSIEPGGGLVLFRAGRMKDKFTVHNVKVEAKFRPVGGKPAEQPVPGFIFHTEFLPKDGATITMNRVQIANESTSHRMTPGKYTLEYAHPRLTEPLRYAFDFQPGAYYSLFLNLDSPLRGELTNLREFFIQYGLSSNLVKLSNDRWLAAWCNGGVRFATSDDGITWSEPVQTRDAALFNENYNTLTPALFLDKQQTIWVAYFSNQLDIDQLNTGGYRLFLRSSKDGREWSAAKPINMPVSGWPPGKVQLLNSPNGKAWLLYRLHYAEGDTFGELSEFKNFDIPADKTQKSHARNPHLTLDPEGRMHFVWDHFGQTLYYSQCDIAGNWSVPLEIPGKEQSPMRSDPQLIIRGNRLALFYTANQTTFLRRGEFQAGVPTFSDPIKIAPYTAQLIGTSPLIAPADRILFLVGGNTIWSQSASVEDLLHGHKE